MPESPYPATVALVLRSGGPYRAIHAQKIASSARKHLPGARVVCLSDMEVPDVEVIPLQATWPGWWAKMALFEPGLFTGPVLYGDLDLLFIRRLSEIAAYAGPFAMTDDYYRPERAQSGVMAWNPGPFVEQIWKTWTERPNRSMRQYRGDGEWLHGHFGQEADRLMELFPGQIASYKVHSRTGPPQDARIIDAHGKPKPWDPAGGWMFATWTAIEVDQ